MSNEPAGTTTNSEQSGQSRKTSPALIPVRVSLGAGRMVAGAGAGGGVGAGVATGREVPK